jgi:hypothetical protein
MTVDQEPHTVLEPQTGPAGRVHRRKRRRRSRRGLGIIALLLAVLMVAPTVSYVQALTAPGSATWGMRTVDWARAHKGNAIINAVENWYYTRHKPATSPPDPSSLPQVGPTTQPAQDALPPTALPTLPGVTPLPGEGVRTAGRVASDGRPMIYTGYLRPDVKHQSIVAGVAWMRAGATNAHLVAGTQQPGGSGWPGSSSVPANDVPKLVATFNSGFKMVDISGGFYLNGRTARVLRDGQASIVIDRTGRITIGQWGRDVTMNANVVAVRQNLALVVDGGKPVAGLSSNAGGRWGTARNQLQYTWRSGAGLDANGNLIYVAGNNMNLATLAAALADAGIVRGMQLDIHTGMASFSSWKRGTGGGPSVPTKLLPAMTRSADRYLMSDQRDFFYLTAR